MRKILVTLMVLTVFLGSLSGCATVEGLGKDMKNAGKWVEEKAK